MEEFTKLFRYVFAPESSWSKFIRKVIGVVLGAAVGVSVWNTYINATKTQVGELPVAEVIERSKDKKRQIRELLEDLRRTGRKIRSVWLFSRPDATSLVPVMNVGDSVNPLPAGGLFRRDAPALGLFLFGECVMLERRNNNLTCPVSGLENAWGVLVVVYDPDYTPDSYDEATAIVAARRISIALYSGEQD